MDSRHKTGSNLCSALSVALLIVLGTMQCAEYPEETSDPLSSPVGPVPVACFTMTMAPNKYPRCSFPPRFILDPRCSRDDTTPVDELEIRWDLDGDGDWDTEFGPLDSAEVYYSMFDDTLWISACEVRDADSLVAGATDTLSLGSLPIAPDLIATGILFDTTSNNDLLYCDTIRVGQWFGLELRTSYLGDFLHPSFKIAIVRDGVPYDTATVGFRSSTGYGCGANYWGVNPIDTPGTYLFHGTWDATGRYLETNEGNNTAEAVLTVVP